MFTLLALPLIFVVWFGSTALIIRFDAQRQRKAAQARGEVDFFDRSVTPYLIFAIFSGALPLIFYFGTTRKSAAGWLLGLGVCVADFVFVSVAGSLIFYGAGAIDGHVEHSNNVKYFARVQAACASPPAHNFATDPCKEVLDGPHRVGGFSYGYAKGDAKPYADLYVAACNSGRPWACSWVAQRGDFYDPGNAASASTWLAKKDALCKRDPSLDCL